MPLLRNRHLIAGLACAALLCSAARTEEGVDTLEIAPRPGVPTPPVAVPAGETVLIGHRMVQPSNRRAAVNGGGAFANVGLAPIGRLTAGGENGKDHVLGLRNLEVAAELDGLTARTTVKHVFFNETSDILEGVFTFQMPSDAAVDRFAMTIHGESDLMEGSLVEHDKATATYSTLVYGQGTDPGVLEWVDANTFKATIFPIQPRHTKTIVISYLQPLAPRVNYDGSRAITYHYPLATASSALPPASHYRFEARLAGLPAAATLSSTLGSAFKPLGNAGAEFLAAFDGRTPPPAYAWDISIQSARGARGQDSGAVLQAHRPNAAKAGAFGITVLPEMFGDKAPEALDVIFLVDTSASRTVAQHAAAARFIEGAVRGLHPHDGFGIVTFDVVARCMPETLVTPGCAQAAPALEWLQNQMPLGATNAAAAFSAVSTFHAQSPAPVKLVFIGEAHSTYGLQKDEEIRAAAEKAIAALGAEFFVVDLDPRADAEPCRAFEGLECRKIVASKDTPEMAGEDFVACLSGRAETPVLRNAKLHLRDRGGALLSCTPRAPCSLAVNTGATFFGKYDAAGPVTVTLTGSWDGRNVSRAWTVNLPELETANPSIPRLWARARIGELQAEQTVQSFAAATELSKASGVLGRRTAFLVLESEEIYRDFQIQRNAGQPLAAAPLRSKFLAGTDLSPEPREEVAFGGIRASNPLLLNTARKGSAEIHGVLLEVSLQEARATGQRNYARKLTHADLVERRLALTRLVAEERGLPFEPETTFTRLWLDALAAPMPAMAQMFDATSASALWKIVDAQKSTPPDRWRSDSTARTIGQGGVTSTVPLAADEAQMDRLMETEKKTGIKFLDDVAVQLDSHLLAHHIFGSLLLGKESGHFNRRGGAGEVARVTNTRRTFVYFLRDASAEKRAAALTFLSQLALVEGQHELAGQLAGRVLTLAAGLPGGSAPHAELVRILSLHLRADLRAAANGYMALLKRDGGSGPLSKPLVRTLVECNDMPGVAAAVEGWCRAENYRKDLLALLAETYLVLRRPDDAIRAYSTIVEFNPAMGQNIKTPEDFLKAGRELLK